MIKTKYALSFSGGKDSLALGLEIIERGWPLDAVLCFMTGDEFDSQIAVIDRFESFVTERGIPFIRLGLKTSFEYEAFERPVHKRNGTIVNGCGFCGKCRWLTGHKVDAINSWYEANWSGCAIAEYVGYAANEHSRYESAREQRKPYLQLYPLIEWGWDEAKCLSFCRDKGWRWDEDGVDLYQYLDRISCVTCANKTLDELRAYRKHFPKYWKRILEYQDRTPYPYKGAGQSAHDLERRFAQEDAQITLDEWLG